MRYEHQGDAVGGGGSRQYPTHAHSQTHTHCLPRDTQDGWSLRQESDAILTHVRVARPLVKLMGN